MRKKNTAVASLLVALMLLISPATTLAYTPPPTDASTASYIDANRIDVKTIVIVIDTQGLGESRLREAWARVNQMYWDIGENLIIADGDWLYYTAAPFGLPLPLGTGKLDDFVVNFFPKISNTFTWQRVFIYQDGNPLEPKDFGPRWQGSHFGAPDSIFRINHDGPFVKNFIVNGFETFVGDTGIHGQVHADEGAMQMVEYRTTGNTEYKKGTTVKHKYGTCHTVLESYLRSIGVTPDEQHLITTSPIYWPATEIKAYSYGILTPAQQDTYNVWLMQKMREEFDLLPYYARFFHWPNDPPPPGSSTVVEDQPSAWATETVARAIELGLLPAHLQNSYRSPATRGEFCDLAVALIETLTSQQIVQRRVFTDDGGSTNIRKVGGLGIVMGVGNDRFAPNLGISRQEAAVIITRTADLGLGKALTISNTTPFSDQHRIASWASDGVALARGSGIMGGKGNNIFDPLGPLTREECIAIILRLYDAHGS